MTSTRSSKARPRSEPPLVINGWTVFAHPLLLDQLDRLIAAVATARRQNPATYASNANVKLLAALDSILFENIPRDPTHSDYRQGATLGRDRKHWFRAKFFQRYRLFFRYRSREKIIVYAWVNDSETLRKAGSKTDPYTTFAAMLENDRPPDDWEALIAECRHPNAVDRLKQAMARKPTDGA